MEKAVECLINRPLKTDWFSLLRTLAYHALSSLLSNFALLFFLSLSLLPDCLFSHCDCLLFFLYRIVVHFCECDDLRVTKAGAGSQSYCQNKCWQCTIWQTRDMLNLYVSFTFSFQLYVVILRIMVWLSHLVKVRKRLHFGLSKPELTLQT